MNCYSFNNFLTISSVKNFIDNFKNIDNSGFAINYLNNKRIGFKIYSQIFNEDEFKNFNYGLYKKFISLGFLFNDFSAVSLSLRTRNNNFDYYVFASFDEKRSISIKYPGDRICNYCFYNKGDFEFNSIINRFKTAAKFTDLNKINTVEYALNYNKNEQIVVRRNNDLLKNDILSLKDFSYFKDCFKLYPCATSIDIDKNQEMLSIATYYYQNLNLLNNFLLEDYN